MNSIGQSVFELESGNGNVEGQTDKKWTNKRMELHQFQKEPSYDGDLSPHQIQLDKAFSSYSPKTIMLMDRHTDVRHINLIDGLVTCNPPKNLLILFLFTIKYLYIIVTFIPGKKL